MPVKNRVQRATRAARANNPSPLGAGGEPTQGRCRVALVEPRRDWSPGDWDEAPPESSVVSVTRPLDRIEASTMVEFWNRRKMLDGDTSKPWAVLVAHGKPRPGQTVFRQPDCVELG